MAADIAYEVGEKVAEIQRLKEEIAEEQKGFKILGEAFAGVVAKYCPINIQKQIMDSLAAQPQKGRDDERRGL